MHGEDLGAASHLCCGPQEQGAQQQEASALCVEKLKNGAIPTHVAIIMDGNRRWAQLRGVDPIQGHLQGATQVEPIIDVAARLGVQRLTLFAFSTENWARSANEVSALLDLIAQQLRQHGRYAAAKGLKLSFIGDLEPLPLSLKEQIAQVQQLTAGGQRLELVLAINYGGRDEILRAVKKLIASVAAGSLDQQQLSQHDLCAALDTSSSLDPQLLIRTGGEQRISNFLLWQLAYTELYFCPLNWPDFGPQEFLGAIAAYQSRCRRFESNDDPVYAPASPL